MFEQFRLLLIVPSVLAFLYGGWQFWSGKQAVEEKRRTAKPRTVTLSDLAMNPPKKNGEWYQITDGGAPLSHGLLVEDPSSSSMENAPFYLYVPILRHELTDKPGTIDQLRGERPFAQIVVRTQDRSYGATYKTLLQLRSSGARTVDAWMEQNHRSLVIKPPFTGTLIRRQTFPMQDRIVGSVHAEVPRDAWILLEGKKPNVSDNAQLAMGLCLIMGIPTVWMFGLLFAGKLDPPEEEAFPVNRPTTPPVAAAPSAFIMPVAEEPDTKKPRR